MKKGKKLWWILFGFTAVLTIFSFSITPDYEASAKDLFLYRFSGALLFGVFAIAFLIQTDIGGIKQKLGLESIKKKVLFWIATVAISITAFGVVDGMTSEEFRNARMSLTVTPAPTVETTDKIIENVEKIPPTDIPKITEAAASTETPIPTSEPTPTSIVKVATPTPTLIPEETDIDGYVFNFDNAVFEANGLEVTFYSVEFEKEISLSGYSTIFEYSVKNTGTSEATIKFATTNQIYFSDGDLAVLAVQATNSLKQGYESSYRLQPGEETEKTKILLTATSSTTDARIDGIDYPKITIGNIMSTEPITIGITFTGWVNDNQESTKVTFNVNGGVEVSPTAIPTSTPKSTNTPIPTVVPTNTPVPEPEVSLEDSWFSVIYFNVGQGDAALVECDGHYMLIDGGTSAYSSTLYSYLKEREIDKLDIVVASHAHNDHVGGLAGALNYATADLILCPVTEYDTDEFRAFKKYAEKNGSGITVPEVGDTYKLSNATVTINGVNAGADNDTSIVMTIEYRGEKFIFTGDAEYAAEVAAAKNIEGPVMALKVSHHGSDTSSTYQFLREVAPLYAVISCGYGNEYGHPTETVLSRLNDADAEILRTDLQGEIYFEYTEGEWYYGYEKEVEYALILTPGSSFVADTSDTGTDVDRNNISTSGTDYIGNANSMVFHYPGCSSVKRMKESNKRYYENVTREDMINKGYKPCGNCNP